MTENEPVEKPQSGDARFDAVVAGGSFVGLSLALALARCAPAGFRVAVVDRAPPRAAAGSDGRASALSAASCRLLEVLDVWPRLADEAQPILDIDITDSRLTAPVRPLFLHFDTALERGAPAAYMVENARLGEALAAVAGETAGVTLLAPETVDGFDVDLHGVRVRLGGGGTLSGRLLVAADGRRSALRRRAGIKTIGWSYPQTGIVTTVAHEKPHEGRAVQHFLPAGPFAILPLRGDRASLVWSEERSAAERIMALDDEGFLAELTRRFGHKLGGLRLAGPRQAYPLDLHIARSFVADRLALVGDDAHGVHPLAGQGLNIGLRDVAALTEVVVEALRLGLDPGGAAVLARYERWRRFDSAFSAVAMDALNRLFSNDSEALRATRAFGLSVVDRLPPVKDFFVREAAGLTGDLPRLLRGEPV
ncbi:MAG: FAD-dependent monooxygenase [Hyphomicrobiales bacterium]|nr:FAD-dependent monooxygenase [Hyphomicrobiales bacterium]